MPATPLHSEQVRLSRWDLVVKIEQRLVPFHQVSFATTHDKGTHVAQIYRRHRYLSIADAPSSHIGQAFHAETYHSKLGSDSLYSVGRWLNSCKRNIKWLGIQIVRQIKMLKFSQHAQRPHELGLVPQEGTDNSEGIMEGCHNVSCSNWGRYADRMTYLKFSECMFG